MQGILKAYVAAGLDQKQFAKETGLDARMLSKFVNGHCNPNPNDFKKICDRSGLPPNAVATVADIDYGVLPATDTPSRKKADKRRKKASLRFRILPKQRGQVDKDLATLGFATIQSWGDFCIQQLRVDAENERELRNEDKRRYAEEAESYVP